MKEVKVGEVVQFMGNPYLVYGCYVSGDGVITEISIAPFLGDPANIDDINAALNKSGIGSA